VGEDMPLGPLVGKRVLVTRAREQASTLSDLLRARGAVPVEVATIQITRPDDYRLVDAAIRGLDRYDWLVFTSVNGVRWFARRVEELAVAQWRPTAVSDLRGQVGEESGQDGLRSGNALTLTLSHGEKGPEWGSQGEMGLERSSRGERRAEEDRSKGRADVDLVDRVRVGRGWPQQVRIAAIGPATAAALGEVGLRADVVPATYVAEAVVEELACRDIVGKRFLIPSAQEARDVLAEGLAGHGAVVEVVPVYRTVPADDRSTVRRLLDENQVDVVTLTSSSTARNLVAMLGDDAGQLLSSVVAASIGPITSQTARELGITVAVEATEHTMPGLVSALERYFGR